jgi:hypothetical protein
MVTGWQRLGPTAGIKAWADAALPLARAEKAICAFASRKARHASAKPVGVSQRR